jgi:superoxide dismutase, Cu-Zn family
MKRFRIHPSLFALPMAALVAVSCGTGRQAAEKPQASAVAEVKGFLPNTMEGTLQFTEQGTEGLRIQGEIAGLLPNRTYAMHVHEFGRCANPDAPGSHFDPVESGRHGEPGASLGMRHAGDLPNITADAQGKAKVDVTTHVLGTGTSEFSVVGRSIVIHAQPDDYQTQPAGGSGEKIACGVIQRTQG